jgi:hypothetical protein
MDRFSGYYRTQDDVFHFWRQGTHFYSQGVGQPNMAMRPVGGDVYADAHNSRYTFHHDGGRITGLDFAYLKRAPVTWTRLGEAEGRAIAAQQAINAARRTPHPGVEALLRRQILAVEAGHPRYQELASPLLESVRDRFPEVQKGLAKFGRFQSLRYKSTLPSGADVFSATYAHGKLEWVIAAPGKDGLIHHLAFRIE